jgi:hypothetical protein
MSHAISAGNLLLRVRGDPEGAEAAFRAARAADPTDADACVQLGLLLKNVPHFSPSRACRPVQV